MSKKAIIAIIFALLILVGVVVVGVSGEEFQGRFFRKTFKIQKLQPSRQQVQKPQTSRQFMSKERVTLARDNRRIRDLVEKQHKYVEVKTNWAPKEFRELSDKRLVKIFPFPTIKKSAGTMSLKTDIEAVSTGKWTHLGIQGTGVVTSVDYSKQDYNHLLLGTEASGLYKTYDFGENWEKVATFPVNHVNRVAMDPGDDEHYLILANKCDLFESKDGGATWEHIYKFDDHNVVSTDLNWNDDHVFVRADEIAIISEDNGINWEEHDLPAVYKTYTRIKPTGFGLYKSEYYESNEEKSAIYLTLDYGKTWEKILDSDQLPLGGFLSAYDISNNGQKIVAAVAVPAEELVTIAMSSDGGANWQFKNADLSGWPQDVTIDENNPDHIMIFIYMSGLYESFNGGDTFSEAPIDEYDVVQLKNSDSDELILITPTDLKSNHMRALNVPGGGLSSDKKLYLLPTDQGLFLYDAPHSLKNIAQDLYLADAGVVSLTSCPRIYAGLWHVGQFFINSDGTIEGRRGGEEFGAAIGEDLDCKTPVIYGSGKYYYDGKHVDYEKSNWIWDTINFTLPSLEIYQYHDGWWYGFGFSQETGRYIFGRFDQYMNEYEVLKSHEWPDPPIGAFYIEKSESATSYWILDDEGKLWKSDSLENWDLYKDLADLTDPVYYEDDWGVGGTIIVPGGGSLKSPSKLFVESDLIVIGGVGLFVSNDGGNTWQSFFPSARISNIVKDGDGRLFVGLSPHPNSSNAYWSEDDVTGIWYSEDNGTSWELYGEGGGKSWVSGLALNEDTNTLYAATRGESLLKIKLEN